MPWRDPRSNSPSTGSCGRKATTTAGSGSRSLSASDPESPLLVPGSHGLSAMAPGFPPISGSSGCSASVIVAGLAPGKSFDALSAASIFSGKSPFDQHRTPLVSVGSPDMMSTTSSREDSLKLSLSPAILQVISKVDRAIETCGLKQRMRDQVLHMRNTFHWECLSGSDFMMYQDLRTQISLYVRPCYHDIYRILHEAWQVTKPRPQCPQHAVVITGTPGIGKSMFGMMLCCVITQRLKPALLFYQGRYENSTTVYWNGKAYHANEMQAVELVYLLIDEGLYSNSYDDDLLEIWSIGDTHLPVGHRLINRVCITSTGEAHTGEFARYLKGWVKDNMAITLVLPPCTWEEIQQIRLANYGCDAEKECPLDKVRERYDLWGGVPRTVIHDSCLSALTADEEFNQLKLEDAIKYLGTYNVNHYHHSEKFFHLYPCFKSLTKEEYDQMKIIDRYNAKYAKYHWASESLEKRAWAHFRHQQEADVIDFILTPKNDP